MFRWPLLVIGIVIIILAQIMKSDFKALPDVPEKITSAKAIEYIKGEEKKFIEMEATLDTGKVVYGTVVTTPYYTDKPTNRTYHIDDMVAKNEFLGNYVGTVIETGNILSGESILLQTVSEDKDKTQVLRERILAHIADDLWVLSPMFKKGDKTQENNWLAKLEYKGGLINFKDILKTVRDPEIENELSEITQFSKNSLGITIPDKAYILIDGYGTGFVPKAYYPVQGTDYSVFLVADPNSKPENIRSIKGILYPEKSSAYSDFGRLLKVKTGERIGTIVQENSVSYNKRKEDDIKTTSTIGGILLILSLIGFLRKRIKKMRLKKDAA